MTRLHTITIGHGPHKLFFLHGLFGQGKNFGTVAKLLAEDATCVLVDLPNHGRSGWTEYFDYHLFADIVAEELVEQGAGREPVTLVGHSMGGKVAMQLALSHPQLLERLVVEDIAPTHRGNAFEFQFYVDAMAKMDLRPLESRSDADAALLAKVSNKAVRSFLLQNLHRDEHGDGWRWLLNVDLLRRSMDLMTGWPDQGDARWEGPVLWLVGGRSNYVNADQLPLMQALFPNVTLEVIPDASHWVHSDQPRAVADALRGFITAADSAQ